MKITSSDEGHLLKLFPDFDGECIEKLDNEADAHFKDLQQWIYDNVDALQGDTSNEIKKEFEERANKYNHASLATRAEEIFGQAPLTVEQAFILGAKASQYSTFAKEAISHASQNAQMLQYQKMMFNQTEEKDNQEDTDLSVN